MKCTSHLIRISAGATVLALGFVFSVARAQDDDLRDALDHATTTHAPPPATTQAAPMDPFRTVAAKLPAHARPGTVTVSNGKILTGSAWTTTATPLRVWIEKEKKYRDVDWSAVKQIDVIVDNASMEKDWRWLKEGSDEKIFSGKSYPLVELRYTLTLINDQQITGTLVAPVYLNDGTKTHNLALYTKFKGNLDQTLDDVVYIKSLTLTGPPLGGTDAGPKTTKLPLIPDP